MVFVRSLVLVRRCELLILVSNTLFGTVAPKCKLRKMFLMLGTARGPDVSDRGRQSVAANANFSRFPPKNLAFAELQRVGACRSSVWSASGFRYDRT